MSGVRGMRGARVPVIRAAWHASRRRWNALAATAMALAALVHLATLDRFPLPWLDDTSFSSIVDAFSRTGRFDFPVSPTWFDQPMYLYGPVYFVISGALFRVFGEDVFIARLPCLVFGTALLPLLFAILREKRVDGALAYCACLLLATDPIFTRQLHSGRMDTMALFFALLGFLYLLKSAQPSPRALGWCAASGVLAALSLLTTPRPGYLVLAMGLVLARRVFVERARDALVQLAIWATPVALLYAAWLGWAFGSVEHALRYYAFFRESSAGLGYVWPSQIPLLALLLLLIGIAAVRKPSLLGDEAIVFALLGIAGFYLFVKDGPPYFGGTYSILVRPLLYMALALLASWTGVLQAPRLTARIGAFALGGLLAAHASIFIGWSALMALQWSPRDPARASAFVAASIPRGSHVVGDEAFYFAVRSNGSRFQYHAGVDVPIRRAVGSLAERIAYQRDVFGAHYLVTGMGASPVMREYARQFHPVKLASMPRPERTAMTQAILAAAAAVGWRPDVGYTGTVYVLRGAGEGAGSGGRARFGDNANVPATPRE